MSFINALGKSTHKAFQQFLQACKTNLHKPLHNTLAFSPSMKTHLDAVREFIKPRGFRPSASVIRARQNDAATADKDKQICFMLMPRTWLKVEEFRLE